MPEPASSQRPRSVDEALERAAAHASRAAAEALAAARALLDAVTLAWSGRPAQESALLHQVDAALRQIEELLGGAGSETLRNAANQEASQLLKALAGALDAEIDRWRERAESDREARAVLRAFMGIRELLWEIGMRTDRAAASSEAKAGQEGPASAEGRHERDDEADSASTPRVQRVHVRG